MRGMRRLPVLLSLLLVCPLFAQKHRASVAWPSTIRIGGLFATTGGGATLGNASVAALDLAANDINAEMAALRLPYRVETDPQDTGQVSEIGRAHDGTPATFRNLAFRPL